MSLTHSHHDFFLADDHTFHILMGDGETARSIRVSTATVKDLAARDGRHSNNVTDLMSQYRSVISEPRSKEEKCKASEGTGNLKPQNRRGKK